MTSSLSRAHAVALGAALVVFASCGVSRLSLQPSEPHGGELSAVADRPEVPPDRPVDGGSAEAARAGALTADVKPQAPAASRRKTTSSDAGIAFIRQHEGFRGRVYADVGGVRTIGFGHHLLPGEALRVVTEEQAVRLLRGDLAIAEAAVNDAVNDGVALTQNQFDALASFTYNVGAAAFRRSAMLRAVNGADATAVAREFLRWNHIGGGKRRSSGLTNRRGDELALFCSTS